MRFRDRLLRTALPPAKTAEWYGRTRPCRHCAARLLRRREISSGPIAEVLHQSDCPSIPKRKEER